MAGISRRRGPREPAGGRDGSLISAGAGHGRLRIFPKMTLHGRNMASVMCYEMRCVLCLFAMSAAAFPAFSAEYVVFSSGLKLRADRHEQSGDLIRLFYKGGVTKIPAKLVSGFEEEEVLTPEPVAE